MKNVIALGGRKIDISVSRAGSKIQVIVASDGISVKDTLIENGSKLEIKF
jgi:hypothetical protein